MLIQLRQCFDRCHFSFTKKSFCCFVACHASCRVPIDLQDFMYCYAVRAGGGRSWLYAIERYAKAKNLLQSLRLAKSLVCGEDTDILNV